MQSDAFCVAMGAAPCEHWRGSRGGCGSDVYGCRITKRCDCFLLHGPVQLGRGYSLAWQFSAKKYAVSGRNYCDSAGINCASMPIFWLRHARWMLDGDTRLDADRRLPSTSPTPSTYEDVYEPNSRRPAGCPTVGNAAEAAAARAAHRAERRPRRAVFLETPPRAGAPGYGRREPPKK